MVLRDVDRYRGLPRVWVIASAVPPFQPPRATIENYLATIGARKLSVAVPSEKPLFPVSAVLFDLSDPARLEWPRRRLSRWSRRARFASSAASG